MLASLDQNSPIVSFRATPSAKCYVNTLIILLKHFRVLWNELARRRACSVYKGKLWILHLGKRWTFWYWPFDQKYNNIIFFSFGTRFPGPTSLKTLKSFSEHSLEIDTTFDNMSYIPIHNLEFLVQANVGLMLASWWSHIDHMLASCWP